MSTRPSTSQSMGMLDVQLLNQLGRLVPGRTFSCVVESGGGQFLTALRA